MLMPCKQIKARRCFSFVLAICLGVASATQVAFADERATDDLATRLVKLEKRLEKEREKQHIPGVAVAVVKDDRIILAKGFGYADLKTERPVTPETLFAIGSTTKAFTAALIGMLVDDSKTVKSDEVAELLGKYVANFGPFREERFTVLVKDGKLAVDVPGQRIYEIKAPDAEGKWYFALTDQIAVSFKKEDADKAISMTMYQAGFEFECPREGVELKAEVPLEKLQPLVGTYRDEEAKISVKVIISNNRLSILDPGGGLNELAPPDEKEKWPLRANKKLMQVRFNKADDGSIRSMTRFQKDKESEMPRVADDTEDKIPTVESLVTRIREGYGADKLDNFGHVRLTGKVDFVHQGVHGKMSLLISGLDRFMTDIDLEKLGYVKTSYDGKRGWSDSVFAPFEELSGPQLEQLKHKHPLWLLQNWRGTIDSAAILRSGEVDGDKVFVLKLSAKGIPTRTLHVSAESGLVLKEETAEIAPGIGQLPVTIKYTDYRP